jgi:large subunit ribosomal protein L15
MTKRRSKKKKSGSHGYGSSKRNRGAGNRGGRGNAGKGKKAKHEKMTKEGVHKLGEEGFNSRKAEQTGINLMDIDQRIEDFVAEGAAEKDGDSYVFHADEAGYDKVLGKGRIRKNIEVHAKKFSSTARDKLKEEGLEVVEVEE